MTTDDLAATLRDRLDDASIEGGRTWYRALDPAGAVWCESSDPDEVAKSIGRRKGYTLQQARTYVVHTPWEEWRSC